MNLIYLHRRLNQLIEQASELDVLIALGRVINIYAIHFLDIIIDLLTNYLSNIADGIRFRLGYLFPWLIPNQNDSTWWPFKPFKQPTHQHTPFVLFSSLVGMATILLVTLAGATANHTQMNITLPAGYALFAIVILQLRQRRLEMSAG